MTVALIWALCSGQFTAWSTPAWFTVALSVHTDAIIWAGRIQAVNCKQKVRVMNEASSVRNKKDPMILLYKLSFLSCVDIIFIKKEARETYIEGTCSCFLKAKPLVYVPAMLMNLLLVVSSQKSYCLFLIVFDSIKLVSARWVIGKGKTAN